MARNVEIKARLAHIDSVAAKAAALAHEGPVAIFQDDTFFHCPNGRLKLRAFSATAGELIFYQRSDQAGPKESFYVRSPTSEPGSLREALALACGEAGRVIKHRTLYLVGPTRVHLDVVEGLGHFLELEVMLADGETVAQGVAVAQGLMAQLGVQVDQLVADAYVDLLRACRG